MKSPSPLEDSSSSSESEERAEATRIENYLETIKKYSDAEFKKHFRLNRSTVKLIIGRYSVGCFSPISLYLLRNYQYTNVTDFINQNIFLDSYADTVQSARGGRPMISPENSVYMTIWYLANSESFRQLADRFNVTLSCAYNKIRSVCKHIIEQSPNYIKWPSEDEAIEEARCFEEKKGLTNIIGAVDGCHIRIQRPIHHEQDYLNRKGFHSLLLLGTVNSKLLFIDVMAGEPGSMHDSRLLRKSALYRVANEDYNRLFYQKFHLLGDSAFPSLRWLLPPFKDNGLLSDEQRQFNYKHSATRVVIEHAFGLLKGRFRRLQGFENLSVTFITKLVIAACVLHNICILKNDESEDLFSDQQDEQSDYEEQ